MDSLSRLLGRISQALQRDDLVRERIIEVIQAHSNIALKTKNIFLKNGVLEVDAPGAVKNELRLCEEKILQDFMQEKIPITRILYK